MSTTYLLLTVDDTLGAELVTVDYPARNVMLIASRTVAWSHAAVVPCNKAGTHDDANRTNAQHPLFGRSGCRFMSVATLRSAGWV
jgi:hypothetical protein